MSSTIPLRTIHRLRLRPLPRLSLPPNRFSSTASSPQIHAKALTFPSHGEPKDVLSLHTHTLPPAHSNLLTVRLLAAPLNPADINQIQGTYPSLPTFTTSLSTPSPVAVPGNEGAAEILSLGPSAAATGLKPGDWVVMRGPGVGTWRTHLQAPADLFLKLDARDRQGITPVQAATVSVNPCTAWGMLRGYVGGGRADETERLRPGDWFVQNGANSGVGRAAIQLGREWGLRSVNVVRARPGGEADTIALKAELRALGADEVVTEEEAAEKDFGKRIKELTGGAGVGLALNCVGGRSALNLAKLLRPRAWHVTYGAMAKQPLSVPAGFLIFKDLRFAGFWVSKWGERERSSKEEAVREVLRLTREGRFADQPMQEVRWGDGTGEGELVEAVQGTLEGYRAGKGIFVFDTE